MFVNELGNSIDIIDEQLANDLVPISVTLFGIVININNEHPTNAPGPILFTVESIETIIAEHPANAPDPIDVIPVILII